LICYHGQRRKLGRAEIFAAAIFYRSEYMAINSTDLLDYIFLFDSFAAALQEEIVGPLFTAPLLPAVPPVSVLVFPNILIDSVSPQQGYWPLITAQGIFSDLQNHPNIQIKP
jgi:hypothetical protein